MAELTEAQKTWGASPTGWASAKDELPGTIAFFEKARHFRDSVEQPWLGEVFPFTETQGRRVLEIGFGPGFDALKFLQSGADYSGIDITPENVDRTKKHLGFFGFEPDVSQGNAEDLPYPDASFDIVYSNGVLHHIPSLPDALKEIRRVLKPGGKMTILMYHRYSVFYLGVLLTHFASGRIFRETLSDRRSRIEATAASNAKPIVNVYSKAELSAVLERSGFKIKRIEVRKCTPDDVPGARILRPLLRLVPQPVYDAVGRFAGWYIIATATPSGS
ncbi:class I SAM-dependent methyltransferase [Bradyrhizobium sp. 63_E2_N1_3]|uniref:class I SAM-dependent methyltransferase n=1 Tax=Bradyrhizobium sp. 63_E2_N1_3 TaxID=3240373 RepID=UPI003F8B41BF